MPLDERAAFVCECTSGTCLAGLGLTMTEYESAHMCPTWCAVLPGHTMTGDASRVLVRHERFWVVDLATPSASGGESPAQPATS